MINKKHLKTKYFKHTEILEWLWEYFGTKKIFHFIKLL